jgi:hypothetical protein
MNYCSWCDKEYEKKTGKQIYCGIECRSEASKEKIIERYHVEKRKKRRGKIRMCAGGCGTPLSIYNDDTMCDQCEINKKRINTFAKELKDYFDYEIQQ